MRWACADPGMVCIVSTVWKAIHLTGSGRAMVRLLEPVEGVAASLRPARDPLIEETNAALKRQPRERPDDLCPQAPSMAYCDRSDRKSGRRRRFPPR